MPALTPEQILELLCQLDSKVRVRLFFAAWKREEWWGKTRDVTTQARVPHRRGEIELAALVADGFLIRHEKGAKNQDRLVRFEPGSAAIKLIGALRSKRSDRSDQIDRSATIETIAPLRSKRSEHSTSTHARGHAPPDPDLSLESRSMDQRVRPSGEVQEGTDARTGEGECPEVRSSDVQWIAEQWRVSGTVAHQMVKRLLALGLSRRDVREYLEAARRGTHSAFAGLEKANYPLGAACTRERVEPWRASRPQAPRPPVDATPTPAQPRPRSTAFDEAEAISVLLKRTLRGGRRP